MWPCGQAAKGLLSPGLPRVEEVRTVSISSLGSQGKEEEKRQVLCKPLGYPDPALHLCPVLSMTATEKEDCPVSP